MRIIAIDPGTTQSAWVLLDGEEDPPRVAAMGLERNGLVRAMLAASQAEHLAIEMVACYGMPVGATTFETCLWIGRFIELWQRPYTKIYRKADTCMRLCNSSRANDANIAQAIRDRYPATGGGAKPQVGTKKQPGPLYGVKKDIWQALGVGLAWFDIQKEERAR